jgi:DNA repair photolyase
MTPPTSSTGTPFPGSRGTPNQPPNRFQAYHFEPDPETESDPTEAPARRTEFLRDLSATVISRNDSPDIPFQVSLNPYRGCEHGCVYCYARPTHEFLGFSAGLDFESRILVKEQAPELLRAELSAPSWNPTWMALSGVTDPYQPVERRRHITRRCLEVLVEFRQPVGVVTKNALVTRDIDLLQRLAHHRAAGVALSLTTLDPALRRVLEPRTSPPEARLATLTQLAQAGIPVGVMLAPIIPALNDHEIPALLQAARDAGATWASYQILRLPHGVKDLFSDWLDRHYPDRKEKVLHQQQNLRGGRLNDPRFGARMAGTGLHADHLARLFDVTRRRAGLNAEGPELSGAAFRRPGGTQLTFPLETPG